MSFAYPTLAVAALVIGWSITKSGTGLTWSEFLKGSFLWWWPR